MKIYHEQICKHYYHVTAGCRWHNFQIKRKIKNEKQEVQASSIQKVLIEIKRYLKTLPATEVFMFAL